MATLSSILAWEIPWTEEPGRLQSMGSLRVGHDLATKWNKNKTHKMRIKGFKKVLSIHIMTTVMCFLKYQGVCVCVKHFGNTALPWNPSTWSLWMTRWRDSEAGSRRGGGASLQSGESREGDELHLFPLTHKALPARASIRPRSALHMPLELGVAQMSGVLSLLGWCVHPPTSRRLCTELGQPLSCPVPAPCPLSYCPAPRLPTGEEAGGLPLWPSQVCSPLLRAKMGNPLQELGLRGSLKPFFLVSHGM